MNPPETTKLHASTRTAYGAVTSAISPPETPGPAIAAPETVICELRVPLDERLAVDELRQVRLVRDVEEDREDPDEEADDVELRERQVAEGR